MSSARLAQQLNILDHDRRHPRTPDSCHRSVTLASRNDPTVASHQHRLARCTVAVLDWTRIPETWPWATQLETAFHRVRAPHLTHQRQLQQEQRLNIGSCCHGGAFTRFSVS